MMRALISVSDKSGLVDFCRILIDSGFEIFSTGGTANHLEENNIPVKRIGDYTGSKKFLGGRVKTLHTKILGGILARQDEKKDMEELKERDILSFDMVVVNPYPFEESVKKEGITIAEAIEKIDIGGITLMRAAAKNFKYVAAICSPSQYKIVADELKSKKRVSEDTRKRLAVKVFRETTKYEAAIDKYFSSILLDEDVLHSHYGLGKELRYGENPHQKAAFFPNLSCGKMEQLHGKKLSYNNYLDWDAAQAVVQEFNEPAVAIVKHTNPCGIATGKNMRSALEAAWSGDVVSSYGSVIAFSKKVDLLTAEFLKDKFVEIVIAPDYNQDALKFLKEKSKNLRILKVDMQQAKRQYRHVLAGILEQDTNDKLYDKFECVTKAKFPEGKKALASFTIVACKHTKSNAVILGTEYEKGHYKVLGMGAGQPNRVDSLKKLAVTKARENIEREHGKDAIDEQFKECVLVSDAFFPFDDTVREASSHGINYIVQPGGSIRDEEVIKTCDELGLSMVFTGTRHFKH